MTKTLMENLVALQNLQFGKGELSTAQQTQISELRAKIPNQVLGHYDRLVARGKKGVAVVRHRVCGECHITVPIGTVGALTFGTDVQLCDSCGRYLYLPEDEPLGFEPVAAVARPKVVAGKRKRKAPADVAR